MEKNGSFSVVCLRHFAPSSLPTVGVGDVDASECVLSYDRRFLCSLEGGSVRVYQLPTSVTSLVSRKDSGAPQEETCHVDAVTLNADPSTATKVFQLCKQILDLQNFVWLHSPDEKEIDLQNNQIFEHKGVPILAAVHNWKLTFWRFDSPPGSFEWAVDGKNPTDPETFKFRWTTAQQHCVCLWKVAEMFPDSQCAPQDGVQIAGDGASLVVVIGGVQCIVFEVTHNYMMVARRFFLQEGSNFAENEKQSREKVSTVVIDNAADNSHADPLLTFVKICALKDWLFTITRSKLLIWSLHGVAFASIELEFLEGDMVNFAPALDLLQICVCTSSHAVYVVNLEAYLQHKHDWDLMRERTRSVEGIPLIEQTTALCQELSVYPKAFAFFQHKDPWQNDRIEPSTKDMSPYTWCERVFFAEGHSRWRGPSSTSHSGGRVLNGFRRPIGDAVSKASVDDARKMWIHKVELPIMARAFLPPMFSSSESEESSVAFSLETDKGVRITPHVTATNIFLEIVGSVPSGKEKVKQLHALAVCSRGAITANSTFYAFVANDPWLALFTQDHIWYLIHEHKLYSFLLQPPVQVISNLLIFESHSKASALCTANGWPHTQLPVLTLFLSLRYRELNGISGSLQNLLPDQEMEAAHMIMSFINNGYTVPQSYKPPFSSAVSQVRELQSVVSSLGSTPAPPDRSFGSRLLDMTLRFLTQLIQSRVEQLESHPHALKALTYLQPTHAEKEAPRVSEMVRELSELTMYMQCIRSLQQGMTTPNTDTEVVIPCPATSASGPQLAEPMRPKTKPLDDWLQKPGVNALDAPESIVREALISGRVSTALQWLSGTYRLKRPQAEVFEEFRLIAQRLAYELCCNQQIDFVFVAVHMLRNAGENVNKFFKNVAFNTSKRLVRCRLLKHLAHMARLTKDESTLVEQMSILEQLYTNPCYTAEFNRMTTASVNVKYPEKSLPGIPPFVAWPFGGNAMLNIGLDGETVERRTPGGQRDRVAREQTLPAFQRYCLELQDPWAAFSSHKLQAVLDAPSDARKAWAQLTCGDLDDIEPQPVLGLANFRGPEAHQAALPEDEEPERSNWSSHEATASKKNQCRECREEENNERGFWWPSVADEKDKLMKGLGLINGPARHNIGYLHLTLSWAAQWTASSWMRILMEKTHYRPDLIESLPWLSAVSKSTWLDVWYDFFVAHQDWRGLNQWVRHLPLEEKHMVDERGHSTFNLDHLEATLEQDNVCIVNEMVLQVLVQSKGVFHQVDVASFQHLLKRLAKAGRLLGAGAAGEASPSDKSEKALSLRRLLPREAPSPFHRFFLHFCIENDLPNAMVFYLQNYALGNNLESLKALELRPKKPWASLQLAGRLGNLYLFAASLQHAAIVTNSPEASKDSSGVPFISLNKMAELTDGAIMFLATLMFAPITSASEAFTCDLNLPWHVEKAKFFAVVKQFPVLQAAFESAHKESVAGDENNLNGNVPKQQEQRSATLAANLIDTVSCANLQRWGAQAEPHSPIICDPGECDFDLTTLTTYKGDVLLRDLLADVVAFDVDDALQPLDVLERDPLELHKIRTSHEKYDADRSCDTLDEAYYLAQGRAMMAYHVRNGARPTPTIDTRRLYQICTSVALHNLLNEGAVSSAVCFLELCSLDTEMLRVDVQAAKRIYEHKHRSEAPRQVEDIDVGAANVIELFLSFPEYGGSVEKAAEAAMNSSHLLTSLRMLEESTWALDPHPSAPSSTVSWDSLAYDSPWHLVALFCRVHCLPRSLTLLHELARNNDWVMFLHEADLQECPADTVVDIVDGYFTDVALQAHLRILAHSILREDRTQVDASGRGLAGREDKPKECNALDILMKYRRMARSGHLCTGADGGPGRGLLDQAQRVRSPRLAVIASCFDDVTALECMTVWVCVNTDKLLVDPTPPVTWKPRTLALQLAQLTKGNEFNLVLKALQLFDPNNPLVDFVRFHKAFVQCRFEQSREFLCRFVQRRESDEENAADYCLPLPFVKRLSDDAVQYLLDEYPDIRSHLLRSLEIASFSPYHTHLYRVYRLITQSGLDVDFRVHGSQLLQLLISKKMYAEAREFAKHQDMPGDTIIFEEVTGRIVEFRQGVWWGVLDERLRLWQKCYDLFIQHQYPKKLAAGFFLDLTTKLERDLYAREQAMLLCIANELFLAGDVKYALRERIEFSILLILAGINDKVVHKLEFDPCVNLSFAHVKEVLKDIPDNVSALPLVFQETIPERELPAAMILRPYLETAISALICRDQLLWARQLTIGFNFTSYDFRIAECMEFVSYQSPEAAHAVEDVFGKDVSLDLMSVEGILDLLAAKCSPRIQLFSERIRAFHKICTVAELPFAAVSKSDPIDLVDHLLMTPHPFAAEQLALCDTLLRCTSLADTRRLTQVVVRRFVQSLMSDRFYGFEWPRDTLCGLVALCTRQSPRPSQDGDAAALGDAAMACLATLVAETTIVDNGRGHVAGGEGEGCVVTYDWKFDESTKLPMEAEAEVLILAYEAYVQGCSEMRIGRLLRFLEVRSEVYVRFGQYGLLRHFLAAIPEYGRMQYMFMHLLKAHQIPYLVMDLKKTKDMVLPGSCSALATALISFLSTHCVVTHFELLVNTHLSLGLDAQLADLLQRKADKILQLLGRSWTRICSQNGEQRLLMCFSLYLQCSKFYLKSGRMERHLAANKQAALIALQIKAVQLHLAMSLNEAHAATVCASGTNGEKKLEDEHATLIDEPFIHEDTHIDDLKKSKFLHLYAKQGHAKPKPKLSSLGSAGDPFLLINLQEAEVATFAEYHRDFITAYTVVQAYACVFGQHVHKVWPRALYRQVVVPGHVAYLRLFRECEPLTNTTLEEVVRLYIEDTSHTREEEKLCSKEDRQNWPDREESMMAFLREVQNLSQRLKLARKLGPGFEGMCMETASMVYTT